MSKSYIKQPNGRWSVFCSVSDTFDAINLTEAQLVAFVRSQAADRAEWDLKHKLGRYDVDREAVTGYSLKQACKLHLQCQKNVTDLKLRLAMRKFCKDVLGKKFRTVSKWHCNECGSKWTRASKTSPKICPRCRRSGAMRWEGDVQEEVT